VRAEVPTRVLWLLALSALLSRCQPLDMHLCSICCPTTSPSGVETARWARWSTCQHPHSLARVASCRRRVRTTCLSPVAGASLRASAETAVSQHLRCLLQPTGSSQEDHLTRPCSSAQSSSVNSHLPMSCCCCFRCWLDVLALLLFVSLASRYKHQPTLCMHSYLGHQAPRGQGIIHVSIPAQTSSQCN
jgi:hypothetical protein